MLRDLPVMPRDDPNFVAECGKAEARLLSWYPVFGMVWERYEYAAQPWVKNFSTNVDNNYRGLLDMYIVDDPDRKI